MLNIKIFVLSVFLFFGGIDTNAQAPQLSENWIKQNIYPVEAASTALSELEFLKTEIGKKRVVFLGEATHMDGATFEARTNVIKYLMEEMGFEVILFEAGMFDLTVANQNFQQTGEAKDIRKSLWNFWRTKEWNTFYEYLDQRKTQGKNTEMAGFDCKFSSSYGFKNNNYSKALQDVFQQKKPELVKADLYLEYIAIWHRIEAGYQKSGLRGSLAKVRYKMDNKEKERFRYLSIWVANQLNGIDEKAWGQQLRSNDEGILAYSDFRLLKFLFNKKKFIPINNRRDELMAENLTHLLKHTYPNKKVIVIGATYHFIRNNNSINPITIQAIPVHESKIAGDLLYKTFADDVYCIGFTAYEGEYGQGKENKKGSSVKSPGANSLEFQLANLKINHAFVSLKDVQNEPFFEGPVVLRLFDHQSNPSSHHWDQILDAVYFIKTMRPASDQ